MKNLLFLPLLLAFIACSTKPECKYSKVQVNYYLNNVHKDEKNFDGCFSVTEPDELGLIEITDQDKRFKVSYYRETDPNDLKTLNVKIGDGRPIEWRTKKGHELFIAQKNDSLAFVFWDKTSAAGSVRGTILYIK